MSPVRTPIAAGSRHVKRPAGEPTKTPTAAVRQAAAAVSHATTPPPVGAWAKHFSAGLLDVAAGRRELRSMRRWMSPRLYRQVELKMRSQGKPGQGSVLATPVSARVWKVKQDTFEVACTVWDRGQMRAVAIRVENFRGRWIAVALEYG